MATTQVLMPSMGEGVNEATLVRWLKKEGEKVAADEPLLEVSTDKVDTEIPSPSDGYLLSIHAKEGDIIQVNDVIAQITAEKGSQSEAAVQQQTNQSQTTEQAPSTSASQPVTAIEPKVQRHEELPTKTSQKSSPLVRKIALDKQIDLNQVSGSGLHGRITKRDVEAFLANGSPNRSAPAISSAAAKPSGTAHAGTLHESYPRLATTVVGDQEYHDGVPVKRERMSHMRKLIADHMIESVRVSPHVTTVFEVDLHKVVQLRDAHKDQFYQREGFKLTYTPILIHAAVQAIKKHPIINTSLDGEDILFKQSINIGCAVALPKGLIVPVIKNAGELSLLGIARRLNDIVTRARSKKLMPDDVQGGTFSITNPGGFGSLTSNPIINQPQVAILGIGAIVKRPVVFNDMIAIRPQMLISLTFDHRVIDGEDGAKYLATLKEILEGYSDEPV